ncbi:MAG TPA: hypothetical protein VF528_14040 [Pyrinomonadaceae bacterium]|jgi:hypothetical protein
MQNRTDQRNLSASDYQQCEAHLAFNLSIYDEDADGQRKQQQPITLIGYTQSIGTDSLKLFGPFYHLGYRYLMGRDRALQLILKLPTGVINIQGFPVSYTKISDDKISDGYMLTGPNLTSFGEADVNCLIEVGIVVMSAGDRAKYLQYLSQLDRPAEIEFKILPPLMEQPPQKPRARRYVPPTANAAAAPPQSKIKVA